MEDGLKDKFKFFLDTKEFKFSLADSRRVFQLPQATDNNNVAFVTAPNFNEMLPLFKNELGFSLPLHLPTNFNVEKVQKHLVEEDIEQLMEETKNVIANEFVDEILNIQEDPGTMIEPESQKESLEVNKSADVLISNDDEEEESTKNALIRKKGNGIEEIRDTPPPTPISESGAPRKPTVIRFRVCSQPDPEKPIPTNVEKVQKHLVEEDIEQLMEETKNVIANEFVDEILNIQEDPGTMIEPESQKESLEVNKSADVLISNDDEEEESTKNALIRKKGNGIEEIRDTPPPTPINHHDDDARPEGESHAKRQRMCEHKTYSVGDTSSEQVIDESNPSGLSTQE
nr:hypothetical protein [Tanacetum cinerariifolium]